MTTKQLSVFVENKPGRLLEVTELLRHEQIDIRALSVADSKDFGVLRLIVDNPEKAVACLQENGFPVTLTPVLTVRIDDQPGGLSTVIGYLAEADISIEYLYAFIAKSENTAYLVLRVPDNAAAAEVLQKNGVTFVCGKDLFGI